MAELEAVLAALEVSAAQREEALARVAAPRAVDRLRETPRAGPPLRGDLLRALRMRRGWTQQETAGRTGIAQSTLARWERSEDWPAAGRLHALCYALDARGAELIALTLGLVGADPPLGATLDREAARDSAAHSMLQSSLPDLEFLALEAQLWHLSQRDEAAKMELSYTYGCHARFLVEHRRFAEAAMYVERIQELAHYGYRDDIGWSAAIIAEARIAGEGRRMSSPKRSLEILRAGVNDPFLQERVEYRAWMHSEIAWCLMKIGESDAAVLVSKTAIQMAETVDASEPWHRRRDYARVLLDIGRCGEALDEVTGFLSLGRTPPESLPFLLVGAQALAGSGRSTEASDWLERMEGVLDQHPEEAHFRASADTLRLRL